MKTNHKIENRKSNAVRRCTVQRSTIGNHSRGSTLLLVLAALLLSMILGITYLEIVRQDRRSTANFVNQGIPENVTAAVEDQAIDRITGDLGVVPFTPGYHYFADNYDGDGDGMFPEEPYDYPGDKDAWLSSTAPVWVPDPSSPTGAGTWRFLQVTNLKDPGNFTTNPFNDWNEPTGVLEPDFRNQADPARDHRVLDIYDYTTPALLTWEQRRKPSDCADTDGDGVTDSRPQSFGYAADGLNYYYWVRIVDNSSMLNLNVAQPLTDANGRYATDITDPGNAANSFGYAPRWASPAELDIVKFFGLTSTRYYQDFSGEPAWTNAGNGLGKYFDYRWDQTTAYFDGGGGSFPASWNAAGLPQNRQGFWENYGSWYGAGPTGAGYNRYYYINTEGSLRRHPGLNTTKKTLLDAPDDPTTTGVDEKGPFHEFFRAGDAAELDFNYYTPPGGYTTPEAYSASDPVGWKIHEFFTYEPRHQLTTHSGHSIFRKNYTDEAIDHNKVKRSLQTLTDKAAAGYNALTLRDQLQFILKGATAGSYVPQATWLSPTVDNSFASRLAANLLDYVDVEDTNNDGVPDATQLTGIVDNSGVATGVPNVTHYGLEPLPFIAEVYVQHAYNVKDATITVPGIPPLIPPQDFPAFAWEKAETGYAIELRNPFNRTIQLDGITLTVNGVAIELTDPLLDINDIEGDGAGKLTMAPFETWVIRRDSAPSTSLDDPLNDDTNDTDSSGNPDPDTNADYLFNTGTQNTIDVDPDHHPGIYYVNPADGLPVIITDSSQDWFDDCNSGVVVTLEVATDTVPMLLYQSVNFPILASPPLDINNKKVYGPFPAAAFPPGTAPTPDTRQYKCLSAIGGAYGVGMMAVGANGFDDDITDGDANSNYTNITLLPVPLVSFAAQTVELPANWMDVNALGEEGYTITATGITYSNKKGENGQSGPDGPAITLDADPGHAQFLVRNADIDSHVELLIVPLLGPTTTTDPITGLQTTQTIAEVWNSRTQISQFYLDHAPGVANLDNPEPLQELIGIFLADSPSEDAQNNDNTGNPDPGFNYDPPAVPSDPPTPIDDDGDLVGNEDDENTEMFIPGTININTIPQPLLEALLPAYGPDPHVPTGMTTELAQSIIDFRDNAATRSTKTGGAPVRTSYTSGSGSNSVTHNANGFASTGEFLLLERMMPTTANRPGADTVDSFQYLKDAGPPLINIPADFIGRLEDGTPGNLADDLPDGVADDQNERTLLARWMSQGFAVRSDVYTVYIVVRGYRGASVSPEVEIRRVILVDRSGVITGDDVAKDHKLD